MKHSLISYSFCTQEFPYTATTVHLEFLKGTNEPTQLLRWKQGEVWTIIHLEDVDKINKTAAEIVDDLIQQYEVPDEKQVYDLLICVFSISCTLTLYVII